MITIKPYRGYIGEGVACCCRKLIWDELEIGMACKFWSSASLSEKQVHGLQNKALSLHIIWNINSEAAYLSNLALLHYLRFFEPKLSLSWETSSFLFHRCPVEFSCDNIIKLRKPFNKETCIKSTQYFHLQAITLQSQIDSNRVKESYNKNTEEWMVVQGRVSLLQMQSTLPLSGEYNFVLHAW